MSSPVLELRGVGKSFGAVQALAQLDLQIFPSEVLALVGDNGAGKSTLLGCLSGIHTPDTGGIFLDGKAVTWTGPAHARAAAIETVHQNLALCDNLDVVANLFLGREPTRRGFVDEKAMEARTGEVLKELSIHIPDMRVNVGSLSGGQRQCIAVARALVGSPRVVLLDEPTAALGVAQAAQVLDLVRRLKERGLAVVIISHNLVDVLRVASRIAVLRLGRLVATHDANTTSSAHLVADITGAGTAA